MNDTEPLFAAVLPDADRQHLILAFLRTRGQRGATADEIHTLVGWATAIRVDVAALDLILHDFIDVDINDEGHITYAQRTV